MVQAIRNLGIEYVAANPGSTFEGLQESFINYGNPPNVMPEFITALHEESSVAMAHGYAKAEGKPMLALLHGTIGIQHAAMAIYNAYHDRTPVLMIAGNDPGDIPLYTQSNRPRVLVQDGIFNGPNIDRRPHQFHAGTGSSLRVWHPECLYLER
jgi:hypothetical protein